MSYWAAVDRLAAHPKMPISRLDEVAADQAFAQRKVALDAYRAKGWKQTGAASLSGLRVRPSTSSMFLVSACVDVSAIDFLDSGGRSQVNPNRPDSQRFTYTVAKMEAGYRVTRDTLKGKPC